MSTASIGLDPTRIKQEKQGLTEDVCRLVDKLIDMETKHNALSSKHLSAGESSKDEKASGQGAEKLTASGEQGNEGIARKNKHENKIRNQQRMIADTLRNGDITQLDIFTRYIVETHANGTEHTKKAIRCLITNDAVRTEYSKKRDNSTTMYEIIRLIDNEIKVEEYAYLTFDTTAPFYGIKLSSSTDCTTYLVPFSNAEILNTIHMLLDARDYDVAGRWILTALFFDPNQLVPKLDARIAERRELYGQVEALMKENEGARTALADEIIKEGEILDLLKAKKALNIAQHDKWIAEQKAKGLEQDFEVNGNTCLSFSRTVNENFSLYQRMK